MYKIRLLKCRFTAFPTAVMFSLPGGHDVPISFQTFED